MKQSLVLLWGIGCVGGSVFAQGPVPRHFSGTSEFQTLFSDCDFRRLSTEQRQTLEVEAKRLAEQDLIQSGCDEADEYWGPRRTYEHQNTCQFVTVEGVEQPVAQHQRKTTILTYCWPRE